MNKRIITKYNKLSHAIKSAIKAEFPLGIEPHLTQMRHLIKGYNFTGFIFNYEDTTYLIEWNNRYSYTSDINDPNPEDEDQNNLLFDHINNLDD